MRPKILIVDDDQIIHNSFQLALKDSSQETVSALNSDEGLKQFQQSQKNFQLHLLTTPTKIQEGRLNSEGICLSNNYASSIKK